LSESSFSGRNLYGPGSFSASVSEGRDCGIQREGPGFYASWLRRTAQPFCVKSLPWVEIRQAFHPWMEGRGPTSVAFHRGPLEQRIFSRGLAPSAQPPTISWTSARSSSGRCRSPTQTPFSICMTRLAKGDRLARHQRFSGPDHAPEWIGGPRNPARLIPNQGQGARRQKALDRTGRSPGSAALLKTVRPQRRPKASGVPSGPRRGVGWNPPRESPTGRTTG